MASSRSRRPRDFSLNRSSSPDPPQVPTQRSPFLHPFALAGWGLSAVLAASLAYALTMTGANQTQTLTALLQERAGQVDALNAQLEAAAKSNAQLLTFANKVVSGCAKTNGVSQANFCATLKPLYDQLSLGE